MSRDCVTPRASEGNVVTNLEGRARTNPTKLKLMGAEFLTAFARLNRSGSPPRIAKLFPDFGIQLHPGQPVPTGIAWVAHAACGIAAVAGGLSMQAHVLAATDLGGALGLSADEASWISTTGVAAEGAAVLIAAYLVAAFGIRRVIVLACLLSGAMALGSQIFPSSLIVLRFIQGVSSGTLPVVMMAWSMRAFPPQRRGPPLALFAFASSFPSAIAPVVAGVATDHLGGLGIYIVDMIWAPVVAFLCLVTLPREPVQANRIKTIDWFGFGLLAVGVMFILILLNQGERRFWLETWWISPLTACGVCMLSFAIIRMLTARNPFFDLGLLSRLSFAIGMAEALSLRFGMLMASFAVPQALNRLQNFRAEQVGEAVAWLGAGQLIGFPLAYLWLKDRDARWSLGLGLGLFAIAALQSALIDPTWQVEQFYGPMMIAGIGQGFFLTSVMTFATWNVPAESGATAAGLFNLTRVLGTGSATALVGYFLRIRENEHSARIVEGITTASQAASERLAGLEQTYAAVTSDAGLASGSAMAALARIASSQAFALAFADVFFGIAVILGGFALLVPALPFIQPFGSAPRS
jgi:DHA2 family multidrug resistance protein